MEVEQSRPAPAVKGSDSFDSLFDDSKNKRESYKFVSPQAIDQLFPVAKQAHNLQEGPEPVNTYDEFMDRIFNNA